MNQVISAILPPIIGILELMGVFIVAWTGGKSFWYFLQNAFRKKHFPSSMSWPPAWPLPWHLKWRRKS